MNNIKKLFSLFLLLTVIAACEKDGDKIYLSGHEESALTATESDIVLLQDESDKMVLSLAWTKSTLTVSNPDVDAPDLESIYVQISTENDFSANIVESLEERLSKAYTGAELNAVAKNLSLVADVATPLYFRIRSSVGNNIQPLYSNVVTVNVTAFDIDMTVGYILDSKEDPTDWTLASPEANGIYTGFMGATSWYNFYLLEGDGVIWGNDGIDGSAFLISSESSKWSLWFPGQGGCYYTEVNTVKKEWSALLIPTLTVSGDIEGEMIFDRPNNKWYILFNAAASGTYKIKLQGEGKQYNYTTGANDDAAIDTPVAFAQNGSSVVMAQQAGEITVSVAGAGEYTLSVDLSNPTEWTCQATSGSAEPEPVNPFIYLPGVDDIISDKWTFDNKLSLYNEDELAYAGVVNVDSKWGYSIHIEEGNWDDKYTFGEGDAYEGTLIWQGGDDNIPAPDPGVYLFNVSLKKLTYNLFAVGSEIYVSGLNDVWDFETVLTTTGTPGIFSGEITIEQESQHGFQIHIDDSWSFYFGGWEGQLFYKGSNITDDASLAPGTYTLTVNLIEGTYEFE